MKRWLVISVLTLAFVLVAGNTLIYAQGAFKIPFKFKAGGKTYAAGDYQLAQKGDGQIALRKGPDGEEVLIPFLERLPQPSPSLPDPQLVFDVVGNFEPSYTEYVTEYVLAEVWFLWEEGYLIHTTKGAHQNKIVKGEKAK
jgi:hypothetical protein